MLTLQDNILVQSVALISILEEIILLWASRCNPKEKDAFLQIEQVWGFLRELCFDFFVDEDESFRVDFCEEVLDKLAYES